jgi:hypothetical protein
MELTKQLWVRLTQQSFFSSSDVSATTCFDHFDHHQATVILIANKEFKKIQFGGREIISIWVSYAYY